MNDKFTERLGPVAAVAVEKFDTMRIAEFVLPRVIRVEGDAVGLVSIGASPLLAAGVESTRLLEGVRTLLRDFLGRSSPRMGNDAELEQELRQAHRRIHEHLNSLEAATRLAEEEHEKFRAAQQANDSTPKGFIQ